MTLGVLYGRHGSLARGPETVDRFALIINNSDRAGFTFHLAQSSFNLCERQDRSIRRPSLTAALVINVSVANAPALCCRGSSAHARYSNEPLGSLTSNFTELYSHLTNECAARSVRVNIFHLMTVAAGTQIINAECSAHQLKWVWFSEYFLIP